LINEEHASMKNQASRPDYRAARYILLLVSGHDKLV